MSSFTQVIDLTSSAQKKANQAKTPTPFQPPDAALGEATVETLSPAAQAAIHNMGWPSLMPVQAKALPSLLAGHDLIVQSRTGSGKTGAFLLPLLDLLDPSTATAQALILVPTRELARQVFHEFEQMCAANAHTQALRAVQVYGGVGYKQQLQAFKEGVHLVVGTPGRVLDHLERGTLSLDGLRLLAFDEADEMLSMGFLPAMRQLRRYLPKKRQSCMFSATMPYRVQQLANDFLHEPRFLSLSGGQVHIDAMAHRYVVVSPLHKDRALAALIEMTDPDSAIIFVNTKRDVEYLAQFLRNYGFNADEISGDLPQRQRERVMGRIREGQLRFLVATDVAARGIDISDLSHVFMYDVPNDRESYVHRAGRTARAGKSGTAITLATTFDEGSLLAIGNRYGISFDKQEVPTPEEVEARVSERVVVLMEDAFRAKSKAERTAIEAGIPLVEDIAAEGHAAWLAMVTDAFYHRHLHGATSPEPGEDEPEIAADQVRAKLEKRYDALSNMARERAHRFLPLVEQLLADGEPEILALLVIEFHTQPDQPAPKKTAPKPARNDQKRRNRPGRGRARKPRKR